MLSRGGTGPDLYNSIALAAELRIDGGSGAAKDRERVGVSHNTGVCVCGHAGLNPGNKGWSLGML